MANKYMICLQYEPELVRVSLADLWRECLVKPPGFSVIFKAFIYGRESIEDEPQSGGSSCSRTDENVFRIRDLLPSDRWLTVNQNDREIVEFALPTPSLIRY